MEKDFRHGKARLGLGFVMVLLSCCMMRGQDLKTATSSTITVGMLILDIYDPAAKQLVWTGSASKTIDSSKDPQKIQKNLNKAMQKLVKDFPPRRK